MEEGVTSQDSLSPVAPLSSPRRSLPVLSPSRPPASPRLSENVSWARSRGPVNAVSVPAELPSIAKEEQMTELVLEEEDARAALVAELSKLPVWKMLFSPAVVSFLVMLVRLDKVRVCFVLFSSLVGWCFLAERILVFVSVPSVSCRVCGSQSICPDRFLGGLVVLRSAACGNADCQCGWNVCT